MSREELAIAIETAPGVADIAAKPAVSMMPPSGLWHVHTFQLCTYEEQP
jgi:hypothetical protein